MRLSQGAASNHKNPAVEPADHAIGRTRGGLTSKLHLVVDGRGLPLSVLLTAGPAGDNPQLLPLLDTIRVPRPGPGRPRRRPTQVAADKAYSHPSTRTALRRRRVTFTCPQRSDQLARRVARGSAGGRPPNVDTETYKRRNVVERCFNRLKQWRGIATRYDKTAVNYLGGILLTSIVLWTRQLDPGDTP